MLKKTWLPNLLVLSITIGLIFIVCEIIARALLPAPLPWLLPQSIYESSPSLGFRFKPNQSSYTADKPFRTNAMGLRGPDITWQKPSQIRRILILGDSIAMGYGVREENTFANTLERLLNKSSEQHLYQVINAGVGAYNTIQEVTYFQEEGIRLEPDLVILALYWNDVSDKTNVYVHPDGYLIEGPNFDKPGKLLQLWNHSSIYRLRNLLKESRALYFVIDRLRQLRARSSPNRTRVKQIAVLEGKRLPSVIKGWKNIETQLVRLSDTCRSHHMQLLVAVLPMPQQLARVYPNIQYQSIVQSMCKRHDIQCLDLLPAFASAYSSHTSLFISYDGDHPNERGHAIIARELYRSISKDFFQPLSRSTSGKYVHR